MAKPVFKYENLPVTDSDVLFEDNHIIGINKRAGDLVQADETGDEPLEEKVKKYIAEKYEKPNGAFLGVVHRLDRPVSGVIIFAKTSKALDRLNKLFKNREMHKTYYAVVKNRPYPDAGTLINWLVKDPQKNVSKAYDHEVRGGLRSELSYETIAQIENYFLVKVDPITGRPHQIRVQLSTLGSPIVGDNKYGYPRGSSRKSISLHARKLEFIHPIKDEPVKIVADVPNDGFWNKFVHLLEG
jgi:23S rRNA pseudouridine1911/1915/1917 synthase